MIQFRQVELAMGVYQLQVRRLFMPCMIASGDLVLYSVADPQWEDVPYVIPGKETSENQP